ncbi:MAG: succinyl-diaminopimelate desuccinylase [Gammaproteobacteria bacterium]|nr:succinyl-diaminopimelate desuccinylase [Gammaproteobacteria bacterium]
MIELLKQLIACPSITPVDAGCQAILIQALRELGFQIESLPFGSVENFWARRGTKAPLFVFAGHTDVVPPGPLSAWHSPPFTPTLQDGYLVGRGAADMKGAIAAMVHACQHFLKKQPDFDGSIAFLITGDEEGPSNLDGTKKVVDWLSQRGEHIDCCIVGEASSEHCVGDSIKVGRRGSLSGHLTFHGKQGHIAYPEKARNPIAEALPILYELNQITWDKGNDFFPPTSFQFSNIHAGTQTSNVIPAALELNFNLRYSPELSVKQIKQRVETHLKNHTLPYTLTWTHSASPFLTQPGKFVELVVKAIQKHQPVQTKLATDGGTSDGRFIAPLTTELLELGVCRESIHQINERVKISDLQLLSAIYLDILISLFPAKDQA